MFQCRTHVRLPAWTRSTLWALFALSFWACLGSCYPALALEEDSAPPVAPFNSPETPLHYPPDRHWDLQHVALRVHFDAPTGTVHGDVTLTVEALGDARQQLELDAVDLQVDDVEIPALDSPVDVANDGKKLRLEWAEPIDRGSRLDVQIRYRTRPQLGIYFRPGQVWSQGAAEQTRHWIPIFDHPNDRTTSEMWITVEDGDVALAAGELVSVEPSQNEAQDDQAESDQSQGSEAVHAGARRRTFHWVQREPHPTYLLTAVTGQFRVYQETVKGRDREIPFSYYLPLDHPAHDASSAAQSKATWRRNFEAMPDMLRFLSDYLDAPYPFAKYAQVLVQDFPWGGMENITATTLTDRTLQDERSLVDRRLDHECLLLHELAHQWFGNWISAREWSEVWLNEAFTTYLALLYVEQRFGAAEFDLERRRLLRGYLNEATHAYQRPVVTRRYPHPEDLFDRHTYFKGALVLHMLHQQLGSYRFRQVLREYVQRNGGRSVDTQDFLDVLEETTGQRRAALFDRWIFSAGHPELEIQARFQPDDAERPGGPGVVRWTLRQLQAGASAAPFPIDTQLEIHAGGATLRRAVSLRQRLEEVEQAVPAAPDMLLFDPGRHLLANITFLKSVDLLRYQLRHAESPLDRLDAAEALVLVEPTPEVSRDLAASLQQDEVAGVRAAAARALGQLADASVLPLLTAALDQESPLVRAAAGAALSGFAPASGAADLLRARLLPVATADPSFQVQREAMLSLAMLSGEDALPTLLELLDVDSWHDEIRVGAFQAMTSLVRSGQATDATRDRMLELALARVDPAATTSPFTRQAALSLLATLGRQREDPRIRDAITTSALDADLQTRVRAIRLLGSLRDPTAVPLLQDLIQNEPQRRLQRAAISALRRLHLQRIDSVQELRDREELLEEELRDLRRRIRLTERRQEGRQEGRQDRDERR